MKYYFQIFVYVYLIIYSLTNVVFSLQASEIERIHIDSVESTYERARSNTSGFNKWQVITANEQTQGVEKGGSETTPWHSPRAGNLYATYIVPTESSKIPMMFGTSQAPAVAVAKTLEYYGFHPDIRWPNDVMLDGKKVSGIGGSMSIYTTGGNACLINIGLNINMDKRLCKMIDQPATSMAIMAKRQFDTEDVLRTLNRNFYRSLTEVQNGNFSTQILPYLRTHMTNIGDPITLKNVKSNHPENPSTLKGIFKGINDRGIMILAVGNEDHQIVSGSIVKELQPKEPKTHILKTVRYRFGATGSKFEFTFQVEGLSGKESSHKWTDGNKVSFTIPPIFDNKRCKFMIFDDISALISKDHSQTVKVLINQTLYQNFVFNAESPEHKIDIPLPFDLTRPTVVSFLLPDACLARVVDPTNGDPRKLALAMRTVDIIYEKPQQQIINLGKDQVQPLILGKGFSGAEQDHRWLEGEEAILRIPHSSEGKFITQIIFNNTNALISDTYSQRLIISGEGIARQEYDFNHQTPVHNVVINLPWNRTGDIDLKFEMPNACCPSVFDPYNTDPRKLSINLVTARVAFFIPQVSEEPQIHATPIPVPNPQIFETPIEEQKAKLNIFPPEKGKVKIQITYPAQDSGMQVLIFEVSKEAIDKANSAGLGEAKATNKGEGLKWQVGEKGKNVIRIMPGDPNATQDHQKEPYVKIVRDGKVIGPDQQELKPTDEFPKPKHNPKSHIRLEEWEKWETPLGKDK